MTELFLFPGIIFEFSLIRFYTKKLRRENLRNALIVLFQENLCYFQLNYFPWKYCDNNFEGGRESRV